jgi:hypothetical protein
MITGPVTLHSYAGGRAWRATDCGAAAYLHKENLSLDLLTRLWRAAN